ncbi:DUF447 domain-containing protein [Salinigranum rubrum]|uniref:DUF447 domain-containing protein n=1 Tax=Salinigranum rubrum TaxID=755307 RepID=A0A2I8VPX4_9EURY|nr:DUF447 domain-containing protein [Salinigranum rubrum]AUV83968.1 DUF447 domain-containing protein [Salinigranum rubrum]
MNDVETDERAWPVALDGVTESVVTTLGPNGLWNVAALGLHAPDAGVDAGARTPVEAVTWGNTRTRRNFHRQGGGVVQFVADAHDFVDAALTIREEEEPVLDSADAWVRVRAERTDEGREDDTRWERWRLTPGESGVERERPFTVNRGFYAVVDATVAASRLDVSDYDTDVLLDRLAYFERVVERCGGTREREAFARLSAETGWHERR